MDYVVWPLALARANPLAHVDIVNRCLFSGPRIHRTHVRLLTSKHFAVDCHRVSPYDPRSIILQATTSVIITHPSTPWSPSYNSQQPLDLCSIQPLLLLMVMITVIIFNISTLATAKEDDIHERIFNRPHEILSRYQEEYYLTTRSDTQPLLLFSYLTDRPDSDAPGHFHDQARGEVRRGQAEHTAHYLSITIDIARGWLHRWHSA